MVQCGVNTPLPQQVYLLKYWDRWLLKLTVVVHYYTGALAVCWGGGRSKKEAKKTGVMVQWLQPQLQCGSGGGNVSLCGRVVA